MDGYLPKPIRSQELDEVLDKYVTQKTRDSGRSRAGCADAACGYPGSSGRSRTAGEDRR